MHSPLPTGLRRLAAGLVFALLAASLAFGQPADLPQARALYREARFSEAVPVLRAIVAEPGRDRQEVKDAYILLGRIYLAQSLKEEAYAVVKRLIELEPPVVELDAETELRSLLRLYYEIRREKEGSFQVEREKPATRVLAIADFSDGSVGDAVGRYANFSVGFPAVMLGFMQGATELKVVERERLSWLQQEIDLGVRGVADPATASRAGKMLGAHVVVFGSYIIMDDRNMVLTGRLVEVETGEVLLAETLTGRPRDFVSLTRELAESIARQMSLKGIGRDGGTGAAAPTRSLDAQLSYVDGLALQDRGDDRGALEKFRETLRFDPHHAGARAKVEVLQPLMLAAAQ